MINLNFISNFSNHFCLGCLYVNDLCIRGVEFCLDGKSNLFGSNMKKKDQIRRKRAKTQVICDFS